MKFLLVFLSLVCTTAHAALGEGRYAAALSLIMSKPDSDDLQGVDEEYSASLGAGLRALYGLNDTGLSLRTGLGLRQKNAKYEYNGPGGDIDVEAKFLYLTAPLTLHYMLAQGPTKAGIFGGTALDVLIDDDCDVDGANATCGDENDLVMPLIIGFDFMFTERVGMEFSYEHGLTETTEDVDLHSFVVSGYFGF
jgi:hypothetical protein